MRSVTWSCLILGVWGQSGCLAVDRGWVTAVDDTDTVDSVAVDSETDDETDTVAETDSDTVADTDLAADTDPVDTDPVDTEPPPLVYEMVWVDAATFQMGSAPGEPGREADELQHAVRVTEGFWIGVTEVSQALFVEVTGHNPSHYQGCGPTCPVDQVSWCDAVNFANALSTRDALQPAYAGVAACVSSDSASVTVDDAADGYRLATEAEWELAARGGQTTYFSGSDTAGLVAWYLANSGDAPQPACTLATNPIGLCDASGNVWEWTWDWYGNYPAGPVDDMGGPASGSGRVMRGGSWFSPVNQVRVAYRNAGEPDLEDVDLGMRFVRPAP